MVEPEVPLVGIVISEAVVGVEMGGLVVVHWVVLERVLDLLGVMRPIAGGGGQPPGGGAGEVVGGPLAVEFGIAVHGGEAGWRSAEHLAAREHARRRGVVVVEVIVVVITIHVVINDDAFVVINCVVADIGVGETVVRAVLETWRGGVHAGGRGGWGGPNVVVVVMTGIEIEEGWWLFWRPVVRVVLGRKLGVYAWSGWRRRYFFFGGQRIGRRRSGGRGGGFGGWGGGRGKDGALGESPFDFHFHDLNRVAHNLQSKRECYSLPCKANAIARIIILIRYSPQTESIESPSSEMLRMIQVGHMGQLLLKIRHFNSHICAEMTDSEQVRS